MILVTGANGFIGSKLVEVLKNSKEYKVLGAVRGQSSSEGLITVGDLNALTDWSLALKDVEVVIHTAARVHTMKETSLNPLEEFRSVNVEGTLNLAKQAMKAGVKRFIFLSSIKVNGESTLKGRPFFFDDTPAPEDAYGQTKLETEEELKSLCNQVPCDRSMELVVIRPPLVYGPGAKGNFILLEKLVCLGLPLPFGKIQNRRSLVASENLCDFIKTCIKHPKAAGNVFLVSDGNDLSTSDLLNKIAESHKMSIWLFWLPRIFFKISLSILRKKSIYDRLFGSLEVDITKSRELLEWEPKDMTGKYKTSE